MSEYIGDFYVSGEVDNTLTVVGGPIKMTPPGANRIVFWVKNEDDTNALDDFVLQVGPIFEAFWTRISGSDWSDPTKWSNGPGDYVYPFPLGTKYPNELPGGGNAAVVFTVGPVAYIQFWAATAGTSGETAVVSVTGRMYRI